MSLPPPVQRILRRLHLILGLIAGLILTLVGLSGAGLVFREEIDEALNPHLFSVAEPTTAFAPPSQVMATLKAHGLPERPTRFRFPSAPHRTFEVGFSDGTQAYVSPQGTLVVGVRDGRAAAMARVRTFHETLFAGEVGGWAQGLSALSMLYLVVSGLWMAWRRLATVGLAVRRTFGWRVAVLDLHGAAGAVAALFLLVSATTGSAFFFSKPAMKLAGWVTLSSAENPPLPKGLAAAPNPDLDAMLAATRQRFPAAEPRLIRVPKKANEAWRFDMRQAGELRPNGRTFVWVAPATATVVAAVDPYTAPAGWRLYHVWNYLLHTGLAGGWPHRLLMPLVGLMPLLLFTTGLAIWLSKRRAHAKRRPSATLPMESPLDEAAVAALEQ